jgi:3-phosphoshikimate 1-carboxyvinyltransferase
MAMAFAPLSILNKKINITEPEVVKKSYPTFWTDLQSAGFTISF